MPRITFFSQQVRALELARALDTLNVISPGDRVAVVGAGAAGTTMALALALLGKNVTLYDPAGKILALQSASTRLLHPHIYEWPRLGSLEDKAGLPVMDWSASSGSDVVTNLRAEFEKKRVALTNLTIRTTYTLAEISAEGTGWRLRFSLPDGVCEERVVQHAVLAMGFGEERSAGSIVPENYWRPSGIGTAASEPVAGASYVVSGNGDGALTETLGLLVADFEHVSFTRRFLGMFKDDALRLAAGPVFDGLAPLADLEPGFQTHLRPILTTHGVLDELRTILRDDRAVTINANGPLFSAGKASQLNQCMVFAVLEAAALEGIAVRRSSGFVSGGSQSGAGARIEGTSLDGSPDTSVYNHAILRHGADTRARYAPAGALIDTYRAFVASLLANAPEFAVPPELSAATFALFEKLRIDKVADHASQPMQRELAATSKRIIEIARDSAAHVLVERGCLTLADIADDCERLTERVTIDVHVAPKDLPEATCLIRLARCSSGKIELRVGSEVRDEWIKLHSSVALAPAPMSVSQVRAYNPGALSPAVDACLMRALDHALTHATSTGSAWLIGAIAPSVCTIVASTWHSWRAALEGDAALRFDFLRWLANVDQSASTPWNGDLTAVQRMANALIMVAATHAQQPMTPTSLEHGNLGLAENAVALGTGCETINGEHLSVRRFPDDWGVDALILSAVNEVSVEDPPGRVMDGGTPSTMMTTARRVRPVIIQNDARWRNRLKDGLEAWKAAVAEEFAALHGRQDDEANGVAQ